MVEIGGYRLLRRLGAGGMGAVHEALDADGRAVAIKVLHPQISVDPAARDRLRREVALLHRVRHDAVARVLDAEADGVDAFIVTELIGGETLDEHVRAHGPLGTDELRELAHGLFAGLAAIHGAGIVHRDLKPGNVMLSPTGPVIIDFGIAQVADDVRLTQTGMVTGTPGYLAPEVLAGDEPGPGGDWWAWAAVLVFAATGHPPFGGGPMVAVLARVGAGQVDTRGLEPGIERVLVAALGPEPARRPAPGDVIAVLDGEMAADDVVPPPVPPPPTPPAPDVEREVAPTLTAPGMPWALPPTAVAPAAATEAPGATVPPPYSPPAPPPPVYAPFAPADGPADDAASASMPVPRWAQPLPRYRLLVAVLGLAAAEIAAVAPGPWLLGMAAATVLLGALGYGWRRLHDARLRRGPRRGDPARTVLTSPWYLLVAALLAVPGLVLAAAVGGVGLWFGHGADPAAQRRLLWLVAAISAACLWFVPSSRAARDGARVVLRGLRREGRAALLLLALAAGALLAAIIAGEPGGQLSWWPLPLTEWWMT